MVCFELIAQTLLATSTGAFNRDFVALLIVVALDDAPNILKATTAAFSFELQTQLFKVFGYQILGNSIFAEDTTVRA